MTKDDIEMLILKNRGKGFEYVE